MQDRNVDVFEKIAYTCRQLNSVSTGLHFFNLIIQCNLDQTESVKRALLKCFDSAEMAFAYNKSTEPGLSGNFVFCRIHRY